MDDTILDSHTAGERAWAEVAAGLAETLGKPVAAVRRELASANDWHWSDPARALRGRLNQAAARVVIAGHACESLGSDPSRVPSDLGQQFLQRRLHHLHPFAGALETLRELRTRGTALALVTNGEAGQQREKIDKFDLGSFFDTVLVEGELGYGKPDPRVFDLALERLGATVGDTWIVGDDLEWEIGGGNRYGLTTVWVNAQGKDAPGTAQPQPDLHVRLIAELLDLR